MNYPLQWCQNSYILLVRLRYHKLLAKTSYSYLKWPGNHTTFTRLVYRKSNAETCCHILLWCPVTCNLWTLVNGLLEICWSIAVSVKSDLMAWEGLCKKNAFYRLILLSFSASFGRKETIEFLREKMIILSISRIGDFIILVSFCWDITLIVWKILVPL